MRSETNRKNRERNKRKKAKEKAEARQRWETCCQHHIKPWDCFCSYGCDSCDIHQKCSVCGRGYREQEIQNLKQPKP